MKVIDAFWEKRNLGLTTVEVIIEENDRLEYISEQLDRINADYSVIKLPVGRVDISFMLTKKGYTFVEGMNHLIHSLQPVLLSEAKQETLKDTRLAPLVDDDLDVILHNVAKGMFTTDRVALDPFFSIEQAANRYVEWIKDEVGRGSEFFKVIYKNQNAGFIGIKKSADSYHDFISGIYHEYTGKGLAICMTYRLIEEVRNRNLKFLTTDISANNIASLQSRFKCGFTIFETTYVYVKHHVSKKEL